MIILRTLIFYAWVLISFFVGNVLIFIFTAGRPTNIHFRRAAQIWARYLLLVSGVRTKVEGAENIPKGEPLIFVSNHQSAADIPILLASTPRFFRFTPKKELFAIPIFGTYMKWAGYIPVDRESGQKAIKSLARAEDFLKDEEALLVFPEGTRSPNGVLKEFKRGSLFLMMQSKIRLIPTAIDGSWKIISKGGFLVKPTNVTIRFGRPLSFENFTRSREDYEKALCLLRDSIQKML